MLKKLSEKLGAKFPATTPGCSMLKFARLDDAFLEVFLTAGKPRKKRNRRKKEGEKKFQKLKSLKRQVTFWLYLVQFLSDLCACPSHNAMLVARKASCRIANIFSTRLKLIWPRFFCKKFLELVGQKSGKSVQCLLSGYSSLCNFALTYMYAQFTRSFCTHTTVHNNSCCNLWNSYRLPFIYLLFYHIIYIIYFIT